MRNFLFCIFCLFDDHLSSHHSALDDFDLCSVVIVGSHCLLKLGFSDVIDRGHCHSPRLVVQELFRSYVAPFLVIPEFVVNVVKDVVVEVVIVEHVTCPPWCTEERNIQGIQHTIQG